jgi:hypothetical protein
MYVRIKIFEKKLKDIHNTPIFFYEGLGNNAIRLSITAIIERYYGYKIAEQIKEILTNEDNKE